MKPKLGSGARFAALKNKLAGKAKDPAALAAAIGRKKLGKAKFQSLGAKGKKDPVEAMSQDMGNRYKATVTKPKKSHYAKV